MTESLIEVRRAEKVGSLGRTEGCPMYLKRLRVDQGPGRAGSRGNVGEHQVLSLGDRRGQGAYLLDFLPLGSH